MRAAAQGGFQVRHDAFGWGYPRFGFSVEQNAEGEFLVFSNGDYIDTTTNLYWSSIVGAERFTAEGVFLNEDTLWQTDRATYVGWSNCSTVLSDGRFLVTGSTFQAGDTNRIGFYWFDVNGELLDHKEILPNSRSWITYQHKNSLDGGFILTGVTSATGVQDIFLLKTDSLGNVEWWQTYGHPTRLDYSASVDLAPGGGYYVGGFYPQTTSGFVQWVLRTDSVGGLLWEVFRGIPVGETPNAAVLSTMDGTLVYAAGKHNGGPDEEHWPQLVKLDTLGNELWDKTYGEAVFGTGFFSVAEVPSSGDLIACGQKWYQTDGGFPYRKGILVRADSDGDSLWMREYFYYDSVLVDCQGVFRDVQPTPDGGFVVVGEARGNINGNNPPGLSVDVWVVKVDSLGCIEPGCNIPLGITTQITNLRDALTVFPNPVPQGGPVTVQLALPEGFRKEPLRLSVVSADGRLVEERDLTPHTSQLTLHTSTYASGLYHLHLTSGTTWLSGAKLVVE